MRRVQSLPATAAFEKASSKPAYETKQAIQSPTIESHGSFNVMDYGSPEAAWAHQLSISLFLSLSIFNIYMCVEREREYVRERERVSEREREQERAREREREENSSLSLSLSFLLSLPIFFPLWRKREGSSLCRYSLKVDCCIFFGGSLFLPAVADDRLLRPLLLLPA